jgi:hypothetical protein
MGSFVSKKKKKEKEPFYFHSNCHDLQELVEYLWCCHSWFCCNLNLIINRKHGFHELGV